MRRNRLTYALAYIVSIIAFVILLTAIIFGAYEVVHWAIASMLGLFAFLAGVLSCIVIIREERSR